MVKCLSTMRETWVLSLGGEDLLEKEMATHSSILAGKSHGRRSLVGYSPWDHKELDTTERLHFTSQGNPLVFLPGESQGQRSLVGGRLWGRTESNTTEAT